MSVIVGFGYKARNGKDTSVKAIIDAFGGKYDIRRFAFADELKKEYVAACKEAGSAFALIQGMRVTHNLPDWVQFEFDAAKDDPICGEWGKQRTLLQWWGTEYRRAQDPLYWIKKLARTLDTQLPQFALISDVRFVNEAAWVKLCGGFVVNVVRAGLTVASDHASEHMLDNYEFDFELIGEDGKVEELKAMAVSFFEFLLNHLNPKPTAIYGEANAFRNAA